MKSTTCGNGTSATKLRLESRLLRGILQRRALERRIGLQPLVELGDPRRRRRAQEHLREQLIRIERDRGQQAVNLSSRYLLRRAGRFRL